MRAVPLLVAALLVLSTPAMAMVAADPVGPESAGSAVAIQESDPALENATPNRIGLEEPTRHAYVAPVADLSTTITVQGVAIRTDYETFLTQNGFDDLSASDQREEIDAALDRIAERIDHVRERERRAVADHAAGEIGDDRLIRTFVQVHREAVELERALGILRTQARSVPDYSVRGEVRTLEGLLEVHRSPVRDRIGSILEGEAVPERPSGAVSLETSPDGVVLSTIDDRTYLREAVRYDNRAPDRESQFDGTRDVPWEEFYPWTLEESQSFPNYYSFPGTQLYSVSVGHPQGDLHSHIDGGTGEIYREVHQLEIDQLPSESAGTWTQDGLELSIDRTPYDGPIEVAVTDAETNASVHADVEIEGVPLGSTAGDSLWVLPSSDDYEVTVRDGDRSVNVTIPARGS